MLSFESLLLKELQKQQSRAEFCDIILQAEGVSVPVHSCVLSAFSPRLCEALLTMPSPLAGQRRLIKVQAVEACTLLSLVSVLYSGQFSEDKEKVLLSACKLGINIPQQDTVAGSRGQENKGGRLAPDRQVEKQTECLKKVTEVECQTEFVCPAALQIPSEHPNPKDTIETVNLIGESSWRTDQGLCTYTPATDITLTALQNVQGNSERMPTCQVMDGVPESAMYPTVSGHVCVPQVCLCHSATLYQHPATQYPPHPYPSQSAYIEPVDNQVHSAVRAVLEGANCVGEEFAQFENNIPGFINYFLDVNRSQGAGQRGQCHRGTRGNIKTEGRVRRPQRSRAKGRGGHTLIEDGWNIGRWEGNMQRCGAVARSTWSGQGGGRVGRMQDTRLVLKHQGRFNRRRQGRGVLPKLEGERGRSGSRRRSGTRQRGSRGRVIDPVCQDKPPPTGRKRGRPRIHPLPLSNVSRNYSGMSSGEQKVTHPPAPSMMHTMALPAASETGLSQPMDRLLDDVIAELPFFPPVALATQSNQTLDSDIACVLETAHSRIHSSVRPSDLGVPQPQHDGELGEILDNFLRTFEQEVGACDSNVRDGTVLNQSQSHVNGRMTDRSHAFRESVQQNTVHTRTSNTNVTKNVTTRQGSTASLSQNRPSGSSARRSQKPSGYWQVSNVKTEKSPNKQLSEEEFEMRRMTRSQSRRRKLKIVEELPPAKRRRIKTERKEKPGAGASLLNKRRRRPHSEQKFAGCKVVSALRKVMSPPSACNVKCSTQSPKNIQKTLHGQMGHAKSDGAKNNLEASKLKMPKSRSETQISAFELMKNLLENQRKREEEQKREDHRIWTVAQQKKKERICVDGSDIMTENRGCKDKDGRILTEEHNKKGINKDGKKERMKDAVEWRKKKDRKHSGKRTGTVSQTTSLQQALPSFTGHTISKGERLKNSYKIPAFHLDDSCGGALSPSTGALEHHAMACSTKGLTQYKMTEMPFALHAVTSARPLEKHTLHRCTQGSTDSSEEDEDVDVVEVSSSLSESVSVMPVNADIVLSSEEEDEGEEAEIDVIEIESD